MAYFGFYDPRVVRTFLPIAEPDQLQQLFGLIAILYVKAEGGN